jgi:predicted transposase/invertase (TIGR01784 family)
MKFFFPQIAKHVDFSKKVTFLDKELIKIFKNTLNKKLLREKRQVDLLAEVTLKSSKKKNLFIHIEIQGYKQEDFAKRMFLYYCLLYPKLQKDLISACLFVVKDDINYEPNEYTYEFEDFKISFIYPAVNIYKLKERALKYIKEKKKNIYADITLLFFEEMEIDKRLKADEDIRKIRKDFINLYFKRFVERLKERGYAEKEIEVAFFFLDKVIFSKKKIGSYIEKDIENLLEKEQVDMGAIINLFRKYEKRGLEKGRLEGLKLGWQKGKLEGLKEGWQRGLKQTIIKMYQKGFDIKDIAFILDMDIDTVKKYIEDKD